MALLTPVEAKADRATTVARLLSVMCAALVAAALYVFVPIALTASDAGFYRALAGGTAVPRPFAFRVLAPWLAAALAHAAHRSLAFGFTVLGLLSLTALVFCLALPLLAARVGRPALRWACLAGILLTPVLPSLWADLYLPDLLHAALVAVYLMMLRARRWVLAAALLPLLYLARESTLLLAVVAVVVLARTVSRRVAITHAFAAALGWLLSQRAGARGLSNQRGVGDTLYLAGKVPHNLLKNMLGTSLWAEPMDGPRPPYLWTVPPSLHLGHIHQIGLIGIGLDLAYLTLLTALTTFGIGIAVALLLWERRAELWPDFRAEPWLLLAAVYGLLSFVLAPALGPSVDRLFLYGWPLFFLAVPAMLLRVVRRPVPIAAAAVLLLLQAGLGFLPRLIVYARPLIPRLVFYPHFLPLIGTVVLLAAAADLLRPSTLS